MNRTTLMIAVACLLIGLFGCDTTEPETESDFAIFFLADDTLTSSEAAQQDIEALELESEPWLSETDIRFYDFSSHCIYLKTSKRDFFDYYDIGRFGPFMEEPFVVVTGGIRCYIGSIQNSSGLILPFPPGPYMDELDVWYFPEDVMHISRAWRAEVDLRSMVPIHDALTTLGLLHGGLHLSLDAVSVIENTDTATVQYTYTITNQDQDDLWILDPDRIGNGLFRFFSGGPHFRGASDYYFAVYMDVIMPDSFNSWQPEWFTRIGAGQSLQRTVQQRGYPSIPTGSYDCFLVFHNPTKIAREDRVVSGARYWLGDIRSAELVVQVN